MGIITDLVYYGNVGILAIVGQIDFGNCWTKKNDFGQETSTKG